MTAKTFEKQVQDDHLEQTAQIRRPILVLAELTWSAFPTPQTSPACMYQGEGHEKPK